MAETKLTKQQKRVLDYIRRGIAKNGYPPTVREIGEGLGLSSSATVHTHLSTLEAKGYIKRDASKSRSISIIGSGTGIADEHDSDIDMPDSQGGSQFVDNRNVIMLPLVGQVAAGTPILAEQNIEESVPLPKEIVGDSSSFILKVRGESMIEAGIFDGDYVVVREQNTAHNGEIVVALLGEEATVKTFYREPDRIRLQPENHTMNPIYATDVRILGKVVALFRTI